MRLFSKKALPDWLIVMIGTHAATLLVLIGTGFV
jgi:hypothetical protein